MEEIEAELRASRISQQPVPQPQKQLQPPAQVPSQPGALTMEELEAQMRSARTGPPPGVQQQQPPLQQSQQPPKPAVGDDAIIPDLATIMQQQQMQQAREQEALVSQRFMPPAPPLDPAAAQAAHFARMKSLLDSMSPPVQQAILSLPPPLHFDALMNVIDVFPALQSLQSANLSNPDVAAAAETLQKAAVVHVHETARRQMEEMDKQEAKLRRRLAKIASMAKYNGLMTRSDQDFITRIQVSQLVTPDPYTDDFYAHIYFALRGGRGPSAPVLGQGQSQPEKGRNNNKKQPRLSRRENAMLRMQQQVERIVRHRAERGEKSGAIEGALGKVTTSSTKGMRQMLSVNAKQIGADAVRDALAGASLAQGAAAPGQKRPALNKHEVLRILEKLYDTVLSLEQSRRDASSTDAEALTETLWKELRVLEPLDVSDPHPFVSLLSTSKGKRLLPRALRHLSAEQTLTTMTMIVASFGSLDVVQSAHLLEDASATADREDIERQTEAFANSIVPSMMQLVVGAPMKIVSGMLAVFIERNDAVKVVRSRPGIAFLIIFLSRAESLRQGGGASPEDLEQWSQIFSLLFSRLSGPGMLPSLFPSTRAKAKLPFGPGYYMSGAFGSASLDTAALSESKRFRNIDIEDEPVWNFMAALAVACNMDQQQTLVAELREKILENVISAKEWANRKKNQLLGGLTDELAAAGFPASAGPMPGMDLGPDVRIRNVNLLVSDFGHAKMDACDADPLLHIASRAEFGRESNLYLMQRLALCARDLYKFNQLFWQTWSCKK